MRIIRLANISPEMNRFFMPLEECIGDDDRESTGCAKDETGGADRLDTVNEAPIQWLPELVLASLFVWASAD